MKPESSYDVIVVGGGHAGIEAAHAAAKLGMRTALITMEIDAIGRLSCNPAMGGLGKGHLVREIDAMGGLQGIATDANGIQYRLLNRSKGPAVRAPRVQLDKDLYPAWMKRTLEAMPNLDLIEGLGGEIVFDKDRISGLCMEDGTKLNCKALILTTGTFLNGVMHCGEVKTKGGRVGEQPSEKLAESFLKLELETGRLKTGTPARLAKDSIDFSKTEEQPGDTPPPPMSLRTRKIECDQISCFLTHTNEKTHDFIRNNIHRSPMFTGQIEGVGPRYCPSIEDKVVRFKDKLKHQIFLEPETRHGNSVYPNGVSTSLPADVQEEFIRTIPGLENCKFIKHGYAVEYTYVPPHQLFQTLEVKSVEGLYLAGQINGTSGYEEAAGQGMVAGINAALKIKEEEPFVLQRQEGYLSVMIDDLLSKNHREPYRLFTSRAEFRLLLQCNNADIRLAEKAYRIGMINQKHFEDVQRLKQVVAEEAEKFQTTPLKHDLVDWEAAAEIGFEKPNRQLLLSQILSRPEIDMDKYEKMMGPIPQLFEDEYWQKRFRDLLEVEVTYSGYFEKQKRQVEIMKEKENAKIPQDWDYENMGTLRLEARQVLSRFKPETIGQASRLAGVNPSDVDVLLIQLARRSREENLTTQSK